MISTEARFDAGAGGTRQSEAARPGRPARGAARHPVLSDFAAVQLGRLVFAVLFFGCWQFGAGWLFDPFYFSTPAKVAVQIGSELADPGFYADLGITAFEMAAGFVIGAGAGVALGVLLARWAYVAKVLDPFLLALNGIPRVALAPMLIVWFGIDLASKIFLGATLVFFLTFFNTLSGVRSVDRALCDVARIQGATERQIFLKVILPSASSWILTGLKMSLPFALVGVILGEFLVSSKGLGFRLNSYSTQYNITGALAIVFLMMAMMLVLTTAMNALEARILRWRPRGAFERVMPRS